MRTVKKYERISIYYCYFLIWKEEEKTLLKRVCLASALTVLDNRVPEVWRGFSLNGNPLSLSFSCTPLPRNRLGTVLSAGNSIARNTERGLDNSSRTSPLSSFPLIQTVNLLRPLPFILLCVDAPRCESSPTRSSLSSLSSSFFSRMFVKLG